MKLRLYSDLHLEFGDYSISELPDDHETVLVLAGDIDNAVMVYGRRFLKECCERFRDVIFVLGNHEYYRGEYHFVQKEWREFADGIDNLHYLENQTVILGDVRFIGSTLWTGLNNANPELMNIVTYRMNDARLINFKEDDGTLRRLSMDDVVQFYADAVAFIEEELQTPFEGTTVVVTHHSPSTALSAFGRYAGDVLTPAFHASCDTLIADYQPDYWFYGHTHDAVDTMICKTRILSNQRGYIGIENQEELGYRPDFLIDV